jgi:hypothetical protein
MRGSIMNTKEKSKQETYNSATSMRIFLRCAVKYVTFDKDFQRILFLLQKYESEKDFSEEKYNRFKNATIEVESSVKKFLEDVYIKLGMFS